MKVSVITAFYKGNAYMADYKRMIRANQCHLEKGDELEVLIINDSPEEHVVLPEDGGDCNIFIYDQKQNGGIHAARVRGLSLCTGDYVIFLDQDDRLREDAVATFIATMKKYQTKADKVLVSNAVMEQKMAKFSGIAPPTIRSLWGIIRHICVWEIRSFRRGNA